MATSNCSFEQVDHVMKTLELVFYIPIFLCGVVVNGRALLVFCCHLPWRESTIYMTNLVLMDLILLLPLPFKMHATNHMWAAQHRGSCSILESLYFIGMYGSIYTMACIAVDRWLGICHPLQFTNFRSPKAALWICVAVWVAVLVPLLPVYAFRKEGDGDFHCFHGFSPKVWRPAVIVCLEVFGYVLPALVIVCCSVRAGRVLKRSGRQSVQSRASVKVIYSSMGAFLVPVTPSHLAIFLQFLVHQGVIQDCWTKTSVSLFLQVAMCLSNITCCLDALCYYFVAKEVRSVRYLSRRSTGSQGIPMQSFSSG